MKTPCIVWYYDMLQQHFQRNIVRGIEGFVAVSLKQMEIARKLAEDCCKYGAENQSDNSCVARAALQFGTSHDLMEMRGKLCSGFFAAEVFRRRSKIRESDISAESAVKLRNAEATLTELKSTIMALGREATATMLSVESQ
ncbi:hypothetical protein WN943_007243 [Citrus x changshan-huyou]